MTKRVGVIGGGQLAWMMADATQALGIELAVQTPSMSDPAVAIATHTVFAAIDDAAATAQLAQYCDAITFENEFVDLAALAPLAAEGVQFAPSLAAIAPLLDKYDQRIYLQQLGLPTPPFIALDIAPGSEPNSTPDWAALDAFSPLPVVLKTRRLGYDGQGTVIARDRATVIETWRKWAGLPILVEGFVPFERELAVMAARSPTGQFVAYPVVETQQEQQVCRRVLVTGEFDPAITAQVEAIAQRLLDSLNFVGIMGIEFFLTADGTVLVNETAPRTHNSGHYSLDACVTSQFEQQLRAVCGLPLGDPSLTCAAAVMVNLLGYESAQSDYVEKRQQLAQLPQSHVYWYGKSQSRPGRKLGHVTVLLDQTGPEGRSQAEQVAQAIEAIWYPS